MDEFILFFTIKKDGNKLYAQYNLLFPAGEALSASLGKNASLSSETWRDDMILTKAKHNTGEQQNAYPNTESALMTPSLYQGYAMTRRVPKIPTHGTKTGTMGRRKAFTTMHERENDPSK